MSREILLLRFENGEEGEDSRDAILKGVTGPDRVWGGGPGLRSRLTRPLWVAGRWCGSWVKT